ncbi:MAG: fasciclin domain-containing protein [Balneolaceae bacterium]
MKKSINSLLKLCLIPIIVTGTLTACGDDSGPVGTDPDLTIVEIAASNDNFSILADLIVNLGLEETLSSGDFTVFAPSDEAFANLPDGLVASLSNDQLTEILSYHVLSQVVLSKDLTLSQIVESLSGEQLWIEADESVLINGASTVIAADIEAENGVIHAVDQVLLPNAFVDVVDIAAKDFNLSTLVELVIEAGLVESLKSEGPFTIFAPVNSAFEEISETLETLTQEQVTNVLTFHVVPQRILSTDLTPQQTVETVNGEELEIVVDGESVTVNGTTSVITVDLEGTNGVIHLIDGVLIPSNL